MAKMRNYPEARLAEAIGRVRREFLEMPGLRLTEAQAARLCALSQDTCEAAVARLVDMRFLARRSGAIFVRAAGLASGA